MVGRGRVWGQLFFGLSLPLRLKNWTRFVSVRATVTHCVGRRALVLSILLDFNTPLSAS